MAWPPSLAASQRARCGRWSEAPTSSHTGESGSRRRCSATRSARLLAQVRRAAGDHVQLAQLAPCPIALVPFAPAPHDPTVGPRTPRLTPLRSTQADHGRRRATIVPTIATATSRNSRNREPVKPPKSRAIANVPMNEPPCLRTHSFRAQRYSARVLKPSGCGRPRGVWDLGIRFVPLTSQVGARPRNLTSAMAWDCYPQRRSVSRLTRERRAVPSHTTAPGRPKPPVTRRTGLCEERTR